MKIPERQHHGRNRSCPRCWFKLWCCSSCFSPISVCPVCRGAKCGITRSTAWGSRMFICSIYECKYVTPTTVCENGYIRFTYPRRCGWDPEKQILSWTDQGNWGDTCASWLLSEVELDNEHFTAGWLTCAQSELLEEVHSKIKMFIVDECVFLLKVQPFSTSLYHKERMIGNIAVRLVVMEANMCRNKTRDQTSTFHSGGRGGSHVCMCVRLLTEQVIIILRGQVYLEQFEEEEEPGLVEMDFALLTWKTGTSSTWGVEALTGNYGNRHAAGML